MKSKASKLYSPGKKVLLTGFLFFFCAVYSFGEVRRFIWSTVSGSGGRTIPMSSVKTEVMRFYNQFTWHRFSDVINRAEHRDATNYLLNRSLADPRADRILQQYRRQRLIWLDNHRNFVYARDTGRFMTVSFVIGDMVMEVTFSNMQPIVRGWYPTRDTLNRRLFEEDIDWLLTGFPQARH